MAETISEMARRHVQEGAAIIERQTSMVQRLEESGNAHAAEARSLLALFEAIQAQHVAHVARLPG